MKSQGVSSFVQRVPFRWLMNGAGQTRILFFAGSLTGAVQAVLLSSFSEIKSILENEINDKESNTNEDASLFKIMFDFQALEEADSDGETILVDLIRDLFQVGKSRGVGVQIFSLSQTSVGQRLTESLVLAGAPVRAFGHVSMPAALKTSNFCPAQFKSILKK